MKLYQGNPSTAPTHSRATPNSKVGPIYVPSRLRTKKVPVDKPCLVLFSRIYTTPKSHLTPKQTQTPRHALGMPKGETVGYQAQRGRKTMQTCGKKKQ